MKRWLLRQLRERWLTLPQHVVERIARRYHISVGLLRAIEREIQEAVIRLLEE